MGATLLSFVATPGTGASVKLAALQPSLSAPTINDLGPQLSQSNSWLPRESIARAQNFAATAAAAAGHNLLWPSGRNHRLSRDDRTMVPKEPPIATIGFTLSFVLFGP